ncbi:hypothetical protein BB558_000955 [Smittium angustum]|uniref:Autophagy-related protein 17 n=1 Tax=Smittium angustum TaxID=133377 RepID=A0A2U1JCT0_SMIAN|nr:hypothetical protein BB558_000955 [Smittium angustum]
MLKKLYSLREPTRNGLELASRMFKQLETICSKLIEDRNSVIKIHPELSFLVTDNPTQIQGAFEEKNTVFYEMETVLGLLKNKSIDKCFLEKKKEYKTPLVSKSILLNQDSINEKSLYDYVDESSFTSLMNSIQDVVNNLQDQRNKMHHTMDKILKVPEKLKNYESGSILIRARDINTLNEKISLNLDLFEQFKEDYESLVSHDNQLKQVISQVERNIMTLSEQDYIVLSHDTQEIGLVVGEMQDYVKSLRLIADETFVKSQQYSSFLDEYKNQAIMIHEVFSIIHDSISELVLIYDNCNILINQFIKLSNELWNLIAWYQEYYVAYDELILEMNQRNIFRNHQQDWFNKVSTELEKSIKDEIERRNMFIQNLGQYLPSDLCPGIKNLPATYSIQQTSIDEFVVPSDESVALATSSLANNS